MSQNSGVQNYVNKNKMQQNIASNKTEGLLYLRRNES